MNRTPILLALGSVCSCAADDLPKVDCRGQQVTMLQHPAPLADIAALPGFKATVRRVTTSGIGFAVDVDYVEGKIMFGDDSLSLEIDPPPP